MRKTFMLLLPSLLIIALGIVLTASAADYDVQISEKQGAGAFLTDGSGMTLYTFKRDSMNKSACSGGCVTNWPIFHAEDIKVPSELSAKDFGVITRDDGKKQTTYKGMPLYYFISDGNPGDIKGHEVYNVWFVARP